MILALFTVFHVVISLVAILAGIVVVGGMLTGHALERWTLVFLATTVATSATGFLFPVHHFMPAHGVGVVSLLTLAVAIFALYRRHLTGYWRPAYVVMAILSLYLNFFVLIVQAFLKVPVLRPIAPTQSEPIFKLVQLAALAVYLSVTAIALIRFRRADRIQASSAVVV